MFTNQTIIAIVFRLINFVAVIGIGLFAFKKYLLPNLLLSLIRKKENQDFLFSQQSYLEKQQVHLDTILKEDALMCQDFRSKIDIWKKTVALESDSYEKKRNDIMLVVKQRLTDKTLQQEHDRVQNIVMHGVVTDLEKSLSLYFKDPKQSSAYLNSILQFMDKETL